ncbi:PCYCGC motif-containing (lipo)protein [Bacillus salitolerans]|uniref:PCYCGC motif-containing (Lipo)protein n=1 Tax=Bacillus salitolerans TaxID=1437434 RepID=A0ABW4LSQ7_9BACI
MKMKVSLYIFTIFMLILSACSSNEASEHEDHEEHHERPSFMSGDLREETGSVDLLPSFLADKPENMKTIYIAAAKHPHVLEHIPCYCGCGDSAGHKSSLNCFVNEIREDGSLVWDDHGTRCGVCLEIAAKSVIDYSQGKSIQEIRDVIDETYKEGYANPTPTPKL